MRLRRVYVPNFRNLKDVELTFEPDLQPQVFPIGSENGGGKSTLLQLIFCLLNCPLHKNRQHYLANLIESGLMLTAPYSQSEQQLAEIELNLNDDSLNSINLSYLLIPLSCFPKLRVHFKRMKRQASSSFSLLSFSLLGSPNQKDERENNILDLDKMISEMTPDVGSIAKNNEIKNNILTALTEEYSGLEHQGIKSFFWMGNVDTQAIFLVCCKFSKGFEDRIDDILTNISNSIYLAGPSSQIYLFLDKEAKKSMLQEVTKEQKSNYSSYMIEARDSICNFYVDNHSTTHVILQAFKDAMEKDRREVVRTREYGKSYKLFAEELDDLTGGKKQISPSDDMSSIVVRQYVDNGQALELNPEDLSHGELKRLGLYSWIKLYNIQNAIVLIDEIENGLHPDWQYRIVNDLVEWGDNQYILATHSFYLCEALTPKHVKEIQPKLQKPNH